MIPLNVSSPTRRLDFSIMQHKSRRLRMPVALCDILNCAVRKAVGDRNVDRNLRSRLECAAEERRHDGTFFQTL
jgi:hypothetical protein